MIIVSIDTKDGQQLGEIRIERLEGNLATYGKAADSYRYVAQYAVERGGAIGVHSRSFTFPRLKGNVLALVLAALTELSEEELVLENGPVDPSELDRSRKGISSWPL